MSEGLNLKLVIKMACKKFGSKESTSHAKIYNKNGVKLFENDFSLITHGEILYLANKGKSF
jgi:ribosomal protein S24E